MTPSPEDVERILSAGRLTDLLYKHDPMCGREDCAYTADKLSTILIADMLAALLAIGGDE